jgi:hypothetical protein
MKDCPNCRLVNPDSALRCDCGYDFPSGILKRSYLTAKDKQIASKTGIGILTIFFFLRAIPGLWVFGFEHWILSLILLVVVLSGLLIWLMIPNRA